MGDMVVEADSDSKFLFFSSLCLRAFVPSCSNATLRMMPCPCREVQEGISHAIPDELRPKPAVVGLEQGGTQTVVLQRHLGNTLLDVPVQVP